MKLKVLLVDDEPLARRELRRLLADFAWVDICGEADNIDTAAKQIEALDPDLLFLDIKMPGGSGFDLLEQLDTVPQVIFTTAYDQHAVQAFEVNALDYLLKPVEPERLATALSKVERQQKPKAKPKEDLLKQLFIKDGQDCWFVPVNEVSLFTVEGNYVRLNWGARRPLLGRPLAALEQRLDPKIYFRANRRQVVNLELVESIEQGVNGRLHLQLRNGPEIEVSRRQARIFRELTTI